MPALSEICMKDENAKPEDLLTEDADDLLTDFEVSQMLKRKRCE